MIVLVPEGRGGLIRNINTWTKYKEEISSNNKIIIEISNSVYKYCLQINWYNFSKKRKISKNDPKQYVK